MSKNKKNKKFHNQDDMKNIFNETIRDIRKLVYPHLGKFQRQQYEDIQAKALGFRTRKSQKMPLPELLARKKATKKHIEARKALENELNVSLIIGESANIMEAERLNKLERREKRNKRKYSNNLGGKGVREHNGVVQVTKKMLKHIK
ncbi:hypothetical protein ACR3K2_25560 [Cryptosporidium serpentis]